MKYVLLALGVMSLILFIMMGVDKSRAKRHKWRISERTLLLLGALGGALGGCLGMILFRHKTNHTVFLVCFPLCLLVQAAAVIVLWKLHVL